MVCSIRAVLTAALTLLMIGCISDDSLTVTSTSKSLVQESIGDLLELPVAHANNAVAAATGKDGSTIYSFLGLRSGKTYKDVSKQAFACTLKQRCRQLADVPVSQGRLASVAVNVNDKIYLLGGYTVGEDDSEVSTPEVLVFDPVTEGWSVRSQMPTPVDDTVAFAHRDRYIYLVSGWHNEGNVSLVQVYDTQEDSWFRATDYPGSPVFGHSGGVANGKIIIADGVAVLGIENERRQYGLINEVWAGVIDQNDPTQITWTRQAPHPYGPLYRMAAMGDDQRDQILFVGGGDNAYNYTGIGYDNVPTNPSRIIFAYDWASNSWSHLGQLSEGTMDHRSLLGVNDSYYVIGGMNARQQVIGTVSEFKLSR